MTAKKRRMLLLAASAMFFSFVAAVRPLLPIARPAFSPSDRESRVVYVLDAGHGGEDGGAVSASGVKESDINLAIVLDLNEFLRFFGQKTVLTRNDDVSIYSSGAETLRQKKVSDLKNRVSLVNDTPGAILISIHQNSLPSVPSVHGAQVFYGAVASSAALARSVQTALNENINIGNEKHEKMIDSSIYLMKNADCPAILVECGFLSNAAESERLTDPDYAKTLAAIIAVSVLNADIKETEGDMP